MTRWGLPPSESALKVQTRTTTLQQQVIEADPDWPVTSKVTVEYRFSAGRGLGRDRIFKARYANRGAYHGEIDAGGGILDFEDQDQSSLIALM